MTSNDDKIAKIELMLACKNGYDNPTHQRFDPIVSVSGSQRLEIIHHIIKNKG